MTTNDIILASGNKCFPKRSKHPTTMDQILIESEWTDYLQNLVDFGNCHYLQNFSLKLEMEYDD